MQFLPDGNRVLVNGRDNSLQIVDMRTFNIVRTFEEPSSYTNFSYTNKAIVSPSGLVAVVPSSNGSLVAFDIEIGNQIGVLKPDQINNFLPS